MFKSLEFTQVRYELSSRWRLAGDWEHLLAIAETGEMRGRWQVRPMSRRILAARSEIEQLTAELYSLEPVDPRGLAMARRLVQDGAGPVYDPRCGRSLVDAIDDCLRALDPSSPCEMPYGRSRDGDGRRRRLRSERFPGPTARRAPRHRRR